MAAQRGFLVGGDRAGTARWHARGQIASCPLLPEPAGDAALADLKQVDKLATGQPSCMSGEDAFAEIG